MTDERKKQTEKKKKKSLTENQTQVTAAASKTKTKTYSSPSCQTNYSQGFAFAQLYLNVVTALFFVHSQYSNRSDPKHILLPLLRRRMNFNDTWRFATTKPLKTTSHGHGCNVESHYSNTGRLLAWRGIIRRVNTGLEVKRKV